MQFFCRKFWVFPVFFLSYFRCVSKQFVSVVSLLYCFGVLIEPKQTKDPPKQFEREHIWVFFENVVLFCIVTKQVCLFRLFQYRFETQKHTETNRNKPKQTQNVFFGFTKETETQPKQNLFRFEPKLFLFVSKTP